MEFFENMDTVQKIILGVAVITCIIAVVMYFSGKKENIQSSQAVNMAQAEEVQYQQLPPRNSQQQFQSDKALVMFFAPWCGHCKNMAPIWDEFTQNFDGYNGVRILKLNGDENQQLAQVHGVSGFPTIKMCTQGVDNPDGIIYEGDRSINSLAQFLQQNA